MAHCTCPKCPGHEPRAVDDSRIGEDCGQVIVEEGAEQAGSTTCCMGVIIPDRAVTTLKRAVGLAKSDAQMGVPIKLNLVPSTKELADAANEVSLNAYGVTGKVECSFDSVMNTVTFRWTRD